jgi:Holliday junction DNA helicase RuvA
MLYSVSGKLISKKPKLVVIEAMGLGLEFIIALRTFKNLPKVGAKVKVFCALCVNKDGAEIYGFLTEEEKELFDVINSAPGIGPKSAMALLDKFSQEKLFAVINEGRADLLSQIGGLGQKRSERIILELKNKVKKSGKDETALLEDGLELTEVLKALGYKKGEIEEALRRLPAEGEARHGRPAGEMKLEERLKKCLALLKK